MRWPTFLHGGESERLPGWLRLALVLIALAAIAVPTVLVLTAPDVRPHRRLARIVAHPQRVIPPAELPPVEPVIFQDLSPEDAREYNATIPFSTDKNPAARPFRYAGDPERRERALQCLTAAVLYEAGDDTVGQRAVAQVIINRARHPAFPDTICGVVFQGSERRTGCQFTFTCDGALLRNRWSDVAWQRARDTAELALNGDVFAPVGYSTHYHTDWVVPYWSASLDKVAAVNTHLFFRWTGWWGTPPAFRRTVSTDEPVIAKLALILDAHATDPLDAGVAEGDEALAGALPPPLASDSNAFLLPIDATVSADGLAAYAQRLCGDRTFCKVMVWSDPAKTPKALPINQDQVAAMSFSYLRDRSRSFEKTLWNCAVFQRPDAGQCMKVQVLTTEPVADPALPKTSTAIQLPAQSAVPELAGVHRKPEPGAKPTPQPTETPVSKKWLPPKRWGNIRPNGAKSGW